MLASSCPEADGQEKQTQLDMYVCQPADTTEWQHRWYFPKIIHGNLHFYGDYIKLNSVFGRNTYPFPCKYKLIDLLEEAQVLTMLVANSR